MKEIILKAVYISLDGESGPVLQLQHAERLWVDGDLIRELLLPHENLSLLSATGENRAKIDAALGEIGAAHAEQAQALAAQLASTRAQAEAEATAAGDLLEATRAGLEAQLAEAQGALGASLAQLEAARSESAELRAALSAKTLEMSNLVGPPLSGERRLLP